MGRPKLTKYFQYIDGVPHHTCHTCTRLLPVETDFYPKKVKLGMSILSSCKRCCSTAAKSRSPEQKARYLKHYRDKGYDPEYHQRNRDKHLASGRRYRSRPETKAKQRERYRTDLQFKLARNLRIRVIQAIKRIGAEKADPTLKLLGCTLDEFKIHMETLFKPGMTWENHGRYRVNGPMKWHVDHKRPIDSFDLTDPEQQRICFHYTNLQPLWAVDNLKKGSSLPDDPKTQASIIT